MTKPDFKKCFHCQLDVSKGSNFFVTTDDGKQLAMCCPGCKAVTETIINLKLDRFYQYRDQYPAKAIDEQLASLNDYLQFDNIEIYQEYIINHNPNKQYQSINLYIEGIACAACVWLIEYRLRELNGIESCLVNLSNHQAIVSLDLEQIKLSQILFEINQLGYKAHLSNLAEAEKHHKREDHQALKRIGMAGLGAMQVMMISVGLYVGGVQGIEKQYQYFMQWISMIVTLPIFFYVGKPFFKSAMRSLRAKQLGMDIPITIAIIVIMMKSVFATINSGAEVYFDSVCMFLFFLTLGRYLEMRARHKASEVISSLTKLLPTTAVCLEYINNKISSKKLIAVSSIKKGDILLVKKNQTFPADGILWQDQTSVNESMLTGEFMPQSKKAGDFIYAGTSNISQDAIVKITKTSNESRLSSITHLLSKAQSDRPVAVSMANNIASYFVAFVLIASLIIGLVWYFIDSSQVLSVMLSVLVISCPCALSLATPIALTVSMNKLAQLGFLVLNNRVIEGMPNITHCVFDKTGTLTVGDLKLDKIQLLSGINEQQALAIAGSLEQNCEHPIALALTKIVNNKKLKLADVNEQKLLVNKGALGSINGRKYCIGKLEFATSFYQNKVEIIINETQSLAVLLADENGPLATFYFKDQLRPNAINTVRWLQNQNIVPILLSGDSSSAVKQVANELGIDVYYKDKTPEQKHQIIQDLLNANHKVLVVGDGSNDILAMAGADLSFAMGAGTELTKTNSDAVILNNDLSLLIKVFNYTKRTRAIIKQNLSWAILYNCIALPIAAGGLVVPYVAVIGMSISSLLVTLNALRLKKFKVNINNNVDDGYIKAVLDGAT